MTIQAINANLLKNETDALLKGINAYRGRLVFNTRVATHDFQLAVFGFQSFINEFIKGLEPSIGLNMVDVLNVNNHILQDRARHVFNPETPEGREALDKIEALCSTEYRHVPQMNARKARFISNPDNAKAALGRYLDANFMVFCADMTSKGYASGLEDLDDIIQPVRNLLSVPNTGKAAGREFRR